MKIGSVKFFKCLIITVLVLIVLIPLVCSVVFGGLFIRERNKVNRLEEAYSQLLLKDKSLDLMPEMPIAGLPAVSPSFEYQNLFPALYTQPPTQTTKEKSVCYLTFDDGPSSTTLHVLETLEKENIKATFFVTGKAAEENPDILKKIAEKGHMIGVHTYSHDYGTIYASVESYLEDFNRMYQTIQSITGIKPTIFRFAGGSINVHNQKIYTQIIAEMTRRGFVFYDWNAAASDAVLGGISRQEVVNNVLQSAAGHERLIVLMHDRADNGTTAAALQDVIKELKQKGYRFEPLTNEVEPITYFYPD